MLGNTTEFDFPTILSFGGLLPTANGTQPLLLVGQDIEVQSILKRRVWSCWLAAPSLLVTLVTRFSSDLSIAFHGKSRCPGQFQHPSIDLKFSTSAQTLSTHRSRCSVQVEICHKVFLQISQFLRELFSHSH